jgi:hypothetical protein
LARQAVSVRVHEVVIEVTESEFTHPLCQWFIIASLSVPLTHVLDGNFL